MTVHRLLNHSLVQDWCSTSTANKLNPSLSVINMSLTYLPLICSWWSGGKGGRGRNSPRPKDSGLCWSGRSGRGVAVGMWPASASSRDTLLLDRERRRGKRSLNPLGRPGGQKQEGGGRKKLSACRGTGRFLILKTGRNECQREKQAEMGYRRIF